MSDFTEKRRQKFLDESQYASYRSFLEMELTDRQAKLANPDTPLRVVRSARWRVATVLLERLILDYTAGQPLPACSAAVPAVVQAFDDYHAVEEHAEGVLPFDLGYIEGYVTTLWLLGLTTLLGHRDLVPTIAKWIDLLEDANRGQDLIYEGVLEKLGCPAVDADGYVLHIDAYRALGKALQAEAPDERAELLKAFLEGWYSHMDGCYWHGTHTDKPGASSFFGYWAFEAALVTYLWDVDDSSYRDHLVYPKDLVEYARKQSSSEKGRSSRRDDGAPRRCEAGEPCPREGWWFTPAKSGSRRHFQAGEVMPEVKSDWGSTFWQWDLKQD